MMSLLTDCKKKDKEKRTNLKIKHFIKLFHFCNAGWVLFPIVLLEAEVDAINSND